MKKHFLPLVCFCSLCFGTPEQAQATDRLPEYLQAERFTLDKLNTMLCSTRIDPHWFQQGSRFWYEYKTGDGNAWYVVDPVARIKHSLFDTDKLASEITMIVKDPFTAQ